MAGHGNTRMSRTPLARVGPLVAAVVVFLVAPMYAADAGSQPQASSIERRVMTFYYPWYGIAEGPGGAGKTVHWGRIDANNKNIQASTDYPQLGAYDSHDPKVIDRHCQWAKDAGIDTLIVSWWGHNHYTDRAMPLILDACQRRGLTACIYYETVPRPQTPRSAADDIIKVLNKYGSHPAHLKLNGKPVVVHCYAPHLAPNQCLVAFISVKQNALVCDDSPTAIDWNHPAALLAVLVQVDGNEAIRDFIPLWAE